MKFLAGCALLALNSAYAAPLWAQATADSAVSDDPEGSGDVIIVTGTRDVGRTQFDTTAPVDIIAADAIDSVVSSDLATVLARQLPSFNVQRLPAADGQAFVRPASLRGLSPDHTLVMVNGKRYHRSALLGAGAGPQHLSRSCRQAGRGAARRCFRPIWIGCHSRSDQLHPR